MKPLSTLIPESITNTFLEPGLGREAEQCMRSQPAAAAIFILVQVIMYSHCVWNEQSKNTTSTTNTFAEPGLGREVECCS